MRVTQPSSVARHAPRRRGLAAAILGAALLTTSLGTVGAQASPPPAADPAAISFWNDIAVKVVTVDAGKANAEGFLWLAFAQAAVYNAVVGITKDYKLYKWHAHARKHASPQAAAGRAAYRSPAGPISGTSRQPSRDWRPPDRRDGAGVPDGKSKDRGIAFGERAAARLIHLREDDGRFAVLPPLPPPGPGIWRPTPVAEAPFLDPWLSQLRPLLLRSPSQFRSRPPFKLTSRRYAKEVNEVQEVWLDRQHRPDAGADRHRDLHLRDHLRGRRRGAARPFGPSSSEHQQGRTPLRGGRHEHGRRHRRRVGCQVQLPLLAADHGDPAGGHR